MKLIAPDEKNIGVSRLGLGCAGAWGQAWIDEAKALAIVNRAMELGVTVFDTGPSYSHGHAEPRLGRALRGVDTEKLLISTKVGTHIGRRGRLFHDLSREVIVKSVDGSRRRLGLDTIPLLYLHRPRVDEFNIELADTLMSLQQRGWVGRLGVNSFNTLVLQALVHVPWVDVVMLDYNVLRPDRESLIAQFTSHGKQVVAGSAVANHLFAPRFLWPTSLSDVWYIARAFKNYRTDLLRARKVSPLANCPGWSKAQVALAFVLMNRNITTAMFGTTRMEHLNENLRACHLDLSQAVSEQIRAASTTTRMAETIKRL